MSSLPGNVPARFGRDGESTIDPTEAQGELVKKAYGTLAEAASGFDLHVANLL